MKLMPAIFPKKCAITTLRLRKRSPSPAGTFRRRGTSSSALRARRPLHSRCAACHRPEQDARRTHSGHSSHLAHAPTEEASGSQLAALRITAKRSSSAASCSNSHNDTALRQRKSFLINNSSVIQDLHAACTSRCERNAMQTAQFITDSIERSWQIPTGMCAHADRGRAFLAGM